MRNASEESSEEASEEGSEEGEEVRVTPPGQGP